MTMTRRSALLAGAGALGLAAGAGAALSAIAKPNIVFIMADDFGYADASCYGRTDYATPSIDKLATQGMKFLQAYANSAVCSASRTALITGRYQDRLEIGLEEPLAGGSTGLTPGLPTLPAQLKKAGYTTALIGKWHLGRLPKYSPLKSGYDEFYGIHEGASDYYNHDRDLWTGDTLAHEAGYLTDLLGNRTVSTIGRFAKARRPFFISLHFNAPHWPWEGADETGAQESKRLADAHLAINDYDGGNLKIYAAMVTRMDYQIGRVLEALEAAGVQDNTLVIFTSDNGGERFGNTWPFTGKKTELLEGGLRIPLIARWPGHIPGGSTSQQVAIHMDWLPTLLAAAGTAPDPTAPPDGMNLLPWLTENATPVPRKLFWRYASMQQEAMRDGDWKYLKILGNTFLFNVAEDSLERANWKERRRDIYDRLAAEWQAWNATMLPYNKNYSDSFSGKQLADHFGAPGEINRPGPND